MSYLFPAADIGVMALSAAAAVVLGTFVLLVETKMVPTKTTVATTNGTCHGTPSTLMSNPPLREGKGKGNEGKDGGCHHGR